MGSAALRPSAVVGRLLRQKRREMKLTLREVSERAAAEGERIPTSTLARIEQGKLDPGIRRLHVLLRLYKVPAHLVADLVELESLAVEPPANRDLQTLYDEGVEHWIRGDISQGLAHLFAVRAHVAENDESRLLRQKATFAFAVAARNLGKQRLARQILEELLCEPPDKTLVVRVLVLASSVWFALGSREVALALIRQAKARVDLSSSQQTAWVLHQEAKLLLEDGDKDLALTAIEEAVQLYREINDTYGLTRALVLRSHTFERRGDVDEAFRCLREVLDISVEHNHARMTITGRLELGRLQVLTGQHEEGLVALNESLAQSVLLGDRNAEFLAHYHLWKAHERVGDKDRARLERESARYFVRLVDDQTPEADEVRALPQE